MNMFFIKFTYNNMKTKKKINKIYKKNNRESQINKIYKKNNRESQTRKIYKKNKRESQTRKIYKKNKINQFSIEGGAKYFPSLYNKKVDKELVAFATKGTKDNDIFLDHAKIFTDINGKKYGLVSMDSIKEINMTETLFNTIQRIGNELTTFFFRNKGKFKSTDEKLNSKDNISMRILSNKFGRVDEMMIFNTLVDKTTTGNNNEKDILNVYNNNVSKAIRNYFLEKLGSIKDTTVSKIKYNIKRTLTGNNATKLKPIPFSKNLLRILKAKKLLNVKKSDNNNETLELGNKFKDNFINKFKTFNNRDLRSVIESTFVAFDLQPNDGNLYNSQKWIINEIESLSVWFGKKGIDKLFLVGGPIVPNASVYNDDNVFFNALNNSFKSKKINVRNLTKGYYLIQSEKNNSPTLDPIISDELNNISITIDGKKILIVNGLEINNEIVTNNSYDLILGQFSSNNGTYSGYEKYPTNGIKITKKKYIMNGLFNYDLDGSNEPITTLDTLYIFNKNAGAATTLTDETATTTTPTTTTPTTTTPTTTTPTTTTPTTTTPTDETAPTTPTTNATSDTLTVTLEEEGDPHGDDSEDDSEDDEAEKGEGNGDGDGSRIVIKLNPGDTCPTSESKKRCYYVYTKK
jgi:hypothetical protein